MKQLLHVAVVVALFSGCTTMSLNRNILDQNSTLSDLRYREVVENLANIAYSPSTIPAFSSIWAGTTDISDSTSASSTDTWLRTAASGTRFATEIFDLPFKRTVKENWTLDPIVVPEKLRALRCCCWRVLFGPQINCRDCALLKHYEDKVDCPGYYFDVEKELAMLPTGWLNVDTCKDRIPSKVCYHAKRQNIHAWVTADGMRGLSDFTLILQKIARTNLASAYQPQPRTRELVLREQVANKLGVKKVTLYLDQDGLVAPGENTSVWPMKARLDNLGQDAALHSIITASKTP